MEGRRGRGERQGINATTDQGRGTWGNCCGDFAFFLLPPLSSPLLSSSSTDFLHGPHRRMRAKAFTILEFHPAADTITYYNRHRAAASRNTYIASRKRDCSRPPRHGECQDVTIMPPNAPRFRHCLPGKTHPFLIPLCCARRHLVIDPAPPCTTCSFCCFPLLDTPTQTPGVLASPGLVPGLATRKGRRVTSACASTRNPPSARPSSSPLYFFSFLFFCFRVGGGHGQHLIPQAFHTDHLCWPSHEPLSRMVRPMSEPLRKGLVR